MLFRSVEKNTAIKMRKLGAIARDINMHHAVKKQVPIIVWHPRCMASMNINQIVHRFLNTQPAERRRLGLAVFLDRLMAKNVTEG